MLDRHREREKARGIKERDRERSPLTGKGQKGKDGGREIKL